MARQLFRITPFYSHVAVSLPGIFHSVYQRQEIPSSPPLKEGEKTLYHDRDSCKTHACIDRSCPKTQPFAYSKIRFLMTFSKLINSSYVYCLGNSLTRDSLKAWPRNLLWFVYVGCTVTHFFFFFLSFIILFYVRLRSFNCVLYG